MSALQTVKQLTDAMIGKHNEWKGLIAKGNDMTAEDLEKIPGVKAQYLDLKGQVDKFNSVKSFGDDAKAEEEYLYKPAKPMPHGEAAPESKDMPALVASTPAGYSEVEYKGTQVRMVHETGAGTMGEAKWKTICKPEYKAAFINYIRTKGDLGFMPLAERKTLEEGLDDQGGYTVPLDVIMNNVVQRKPTPTRIAPLCSQINTSREYLELIKLNYATDNIYSTGFRVTKTGEKPASATTAQVTDTNLFGTIKIPVHTFMIRGLITQNMIEDSALNIVQWMSDKFGETVDILRDDKCLNGTGRMEPLGILNSYAGSPNGQGTDDPKISVINTGDPNTVTADGLINLALDMPEQYEDGCRYVFNKVSTFKAIRLLKDLNDRYLFGMGTADSGLATPMRPRDLLGYDYTWSGLMPNASAGTYPVIFGNLQGAQFVNRIGFSIQVLRELYAETNAVALVGRVRFGFQVIMPWMLRLQKVSS